nr:hypothetical protein [Tanacetum cinerariifolium]
GVLVQGCEGAAGTGGGVPSVLIFLGPWLAAGAGASCLRQAAGWFQAVGRTVRQTCRKEQTAVISSYRAFAVLRAFLPRLVR